MAPMADEGVVEQAARNWLRGLQKRRENLAKEMAAIDADIERITQAFGDKGEAETSSPPPLRAVP